MRAVYGTPPAELVTRWVKDVNRWGAQAYFYRSQPVADTTVELELRQSVYQACTETGLMFYYGLPLIGFSTTPTSGKQDQTATELLSTLSAGQLEKSVRAAHSAMPDLKGVFLWLPGDPAAGPALSRQELVSAPDWLPPLLRAFDEVCQELSLEGIVSVQHDLHTQATRRQWYELFRAFPNLSILEAATWPEENTLLPFWGFIPPQDTQLLDSNRIMVQMLTDTEFMGQGRLPAILPRWWRQMAQAAYRPEVRLAAARCFLGDGGQTAVNFNRLNVHLLLHFLQHPTDDLQEVMQDVNKEMFGFDFPSRLSSIMLIAEDALQAVSSVNHVNILDRSHFPPPAFLDRDHVPATQQMKAVDDLFEPPGTPLFPEDSDSLDRLGAAGQWRWQNEVIARPVDEYLLAIEEAVNWLTRIQPEVDFLTLDFPPAHRELFVSGYRDLLLLGRGMYQFVLGAAVYHRWRRLEKSSREEVLQELAPLAAQLRLIAAEADGSSLELQQRLLAMAKAFETLEVGNEQ